MLPMPAMNYKNFKCCGKIHFRVRPHFQGERAGCRYPVSRYHNAGFCRAGTGSKLTGVSGRVAPSSITPCHADG